MSDGKVEQSDGRRQRKDRRQGESPVRAAGERRNITTLREADVMEIYIPPLKGPQERRGGTSRRTRPR
jgi:hypothetical protein